MINENELQKLYNIKPKSKKAVLEVVILTTIERRDLLIKFCTGTARTIKEIAGKLKVTRPIARLDVLLLTEQGRLKDIAELYKPKLMIAVKVEKTK